ncbi:MAG: hypothetical protein KKB59_10290 [Spirochaetes bacterium]|nr:hypothetical protein [Spirochaetota bacterium]
MKKNFERIALFFPIVGAFAILQNLINSAIAGSFGFGVAFNIAAIFILTVPMALCYLPQLERLKILHPIALAASSAINIVSDPVHSYGYVFFGIFLLNLYAYNYLNRNFKIKVVGSIIVFITITTISAYFHSADFQSISSPLAFNIIIFSFIYLLFYDTLGAKMKPVFDFNNNGITDEIDKEIIRLFIIDSHSKAIADALSGDHSASFVDNRLSSIYKKLNVEGRNGLSFYLANYIIENT